jgi:ribonuclease HI
VRGRKAKRKFNILTNVWNDPDCRTATKAKLFTRIMQSFTHNSISWRLTAHVKKQINEWASHLLSKITGKGAHAEKKDPFIDFVKWIQWWQNRKVGRVARQEWGLWGRQEMFRHMHGIRIGRLNKGVTDATIFEGIDIGLSTQDFERLVGVEPRGRTLAGLTVVQRAELELRRAEWAEKLRERKPPGADDSDTEDEDCCGGGGEEAAEKVKMTPEEKLAAEKANALLNQRRRRNCNAMVREAIRKAAPALILWYSTDGGYKKVKNLDDQGNEISTTEYCGYGMAAWRVELWEESTNMYEKLHSVQEDLLTWTEIQVTPRVVGLEAAPDVKGRQRGGTTLGICGQPCRDLKSVEFCGAVDWNANVAEVEGMIQVFLQVLNMREAPPQIGIVYDSDYAYRAITGTKPINKNGALVGVARVLYHRVQWRTKVNWAWCKGHSGHPANERADKLATLAMRKKGMWRFRFIPPSFMAATKKYEDSDDEDQFGEVDDVPPVQYTDMPRDSDEDCRPPQGRNSDPGDVPDLPREAAYYMQPSAAAARSPVTNADMSPAAAANHFLDYTEQTEFMNAEEQAQMSLLSSDVHSDMDED